MRDRFGKTAAVYKGFKEFRDAPTVSFARKERVESEGVSTGRLSLERFVELTGPPAGRSFCPQHACSVFDYPRLVPTADAPAEGKRDAHLP